MFLLLTPLFSLFIFQVWASSRVFRFDQRGMRLVFFPKHMTGRPAAFTTTNPYTNLSTSQDRSIYTRSAVICSDENLFSGHEIKLALARGRWAKSGDTFSASRMNFSESQLSLISTFKYETRTASGTPQRRYSSVRTARRKAVNAAALTVDIFYHI